MASYTRRQILLKREDGTPAGFLRMERVDNRCDVEVHVDTKTTGLTALLFDGEKIFPLGKVSRGRTIHAPRVDEMHRYHRAAVMSGDTLLFAGGEGADFNSVQKALAVREKKADSTTRERKQETAEPNRADLSEPPPAEAAFPTEAAHTQAWEPPDLSPDEPGPPSEGWTFSPCHMGALQCYTGSLTRGGHPVAKMYAVAGAYDPEPPPGLTGFVWDSGYWVKVAELAQAQ